MEVKERCDMACEVLQKTHDGDDLSPKDLWFVQEWVNQGLNEHGEAHFREVYDQVHAGTYIKPWLCEVEHLTKKHSGYVFWKGIEVEHFSFYGPGAEEREKAAAIELGRRCLILEARGVEVSCKHVIWDWEEDKPCKT